MYISFAPVHSKSHIKALKSLLSQCQLRRSYHRGSDERCGKKTIGASEGRQLEHLIFLFTMCFKIFFSFLKACSV